MNAVLLALTLGAKAASSAELVFRSGPEQVAFLELFSSEGCSSCPPADERLRAWASGPELWRDFVPAVFHVDYWDHLGWIDPFSDGSHTARQHDYVKLWGSRPYTPCFVLNAREWRPGADDRPRISGQTGILEIRSPANVRLSFKSRHRVRYRPAEGQKGSWTAKAVLLGFGLKSFVRMGENAGKTLFHDAVVLSHAWEHLKAGEGVVVLPGASGVKRGAVFDYPAHQRSSFRPKPKRLAIAVWITRTAFMVEKDGVMALPSGYDPTPVQAAGGFLN